MAPPRIISSLHRNCGLSHLLLSSVLVPRILLVLSSQSLRHLRLERKRGREGEAGGKRLNDLTSYRGGGGERLLLLPPNGGGRPGEVARCEQGERGSGSISLREKRRPKRQGGKEGREGGGEGGSAAATASQKSGGESLHPSYGGSRGCEKKEEEVGGRGRRQGDVGGRERRDDKRITFLPGGEEEEAAEGDARMETRDNAAIWLWDRIRDRAKEVLTVQKKGGGEIAPSLSSSRCRP